jgi:hypothetical protein
VPATSALEGGEDNRTASSKLYEPTFLVWALQEKQNLSLAY